MASSTPKTGVIRRLAIGGLISVALLVALAAVLVICFVLTMNRSSGGRLVYQVQAANGLQARILETDDGATEPTYTEIHVLQAGESPNRGNLIFKADRVRNIALHWVDANHLTVTASNAHIEQLTNYGWVRRDARSEPYWVSYAIGDSVTLH